MILKIFAILISLEGKCVLIIARKSAQNLLCVELNLIFLVLTAAYSTKRHLFSYGPLEMPSLRLPGLDMPYNDRHRGFKRHRRCLSTTLALLWPQVVGPVEQGVIDEKDFEEVPKTLIEYRLDGIRKKAKEEEERRLAVREYLKEQTEAHDRFYGYPGYGQSFLQTNFI